MYNPTGAYRRVARLVNAVGIPLAILALGGAIGVAGYYGQQPCWRGPLGPGHRHFADSGNLMCHDYRAGKYGVPHITVIWGAAREVDASPGVEPRPPETRKH